MDYSKILETNFELRKASLSQAFSGEYLKSMQLSTLPNQMFDAMIVRLDAMVCSQKKETEYNLKTQVPKNWAWMFLRDVLGVKKIKTSEIERVVVLEEVFILPDIPTGFDKGRVFKQTSIKN